MRKFVDFVRTHTLQQSSFLIASCVVGVVAVLYAGIINLIVADYFRVFNSHPYYVVGATPFLFVLATAIVEMFGSEAAGSGVPQVLQAIEYSETSRGGWASPLVSVGTTVARIVSSLVGFMAGAGIGPEGPTVQMSCSIFNLAGRLLKKRMPQIDQRSYLIAGGAAGIAAAFNAPLAGITFALEEFSSSVIGQFRSDVMFSIVIAGIIAEALAGNYLYFGHPVTQKFVFWVVIPESLLIGIACGLLGGLFARILAQVDFKIPIKRWWLRAFVCGVICAILALVSHGGTAASGYEGVRQFMDGGPDAKIPLLFGLERFFASSFSYLSGMAGGMLSPLLSIGAGFGYTIAALLHLTNLRTTALIGMVAFFSGVVQCPLTAVVIVMEMTDEHAFIIPFMIAAVLAQIVSKAIMETPLYHYLALGDQKEQTTNYSDKGTAEM